jgi:hypothetical protein
MTEGIDFPSSHEEASPEITCLEERETKVKEKARSLTTEERDGIICKYNIELFKHRRNQDVGKKTYRSGMSVTDSEDITDECESTDPMERLAHLLDELAEVGNIAVSKNMRFIDRERFDVLLAIGQRFLISCKDSIVTEKPTENSG